MDRTATTRRAKPEAVQRPLSAAQRLAWLRLIRSDGIGPVTFRELVNRFGSAADALRALPDLARRGGRIAGVRICPANEAEAELERVERLGARLVASGEPGYPPWLAQIEAPPPLICVKGVVALAARPIIAIVGARNGSAAGQKIARQLSADLGAQGFVIASGLARGIDRAAHEAALERGTIAVLAGGIDVVYPPEHASLHAAIAERGLLVCERPPGLDPRAQDFPRRNRLISGMAAGVIVVEAARRSGSLITARFAAEQGRDVFAVPGNPLDPRAEGTNGLLKNGATLVTEARDVVEALHPVLGGEAPRLDLGEGQDGETDGDDIDALVDGAVDGGGEAGPPPTDLRAAVVAALGPAPVEVDELARATGGRLAEVRAVLLELDVAGRLERHPGNLVSLLSAP